MFWNIGNSGSIGTCIGLPTVLLIFGNSWFLKCGICQPCDNLHWVMILNCPTFLSVKDTQQNIWHMYAVINNKTITIIVVHVFQWCCIKLATTWWTLFMFSCNYFSFWSDPGPLFYCILHQSTATLPRSMSNMMESYFSVKWHQDWA